MVSDTQTPVLDARTRQLAGLQLFGRDKDPRDNGNRCAGTSMIEWFNRLDAPKYSDSDLRRIRDDEKEPKSKRMAAATHLRALEHADDYAKNGAPLAGHDVDRLLDRTVGRPKQHVEVVKREVADPASLTLELVRLLADHPQLRGALGVEVAGVLGQGSSGNAGVAEDPPGAPNAGLDGG